MSANICLAAIMFVCYICKLFCLNLKKQKKKETKKEKKTWISASGSRWHRSVSKWSHIQFLKTPFLLNSVQLFWTTAGANAPHKVGGNDWRKELWNETMYARPFTSNAHLHLVRARASKWKRTSPHTRNRAHRPHLNSLSIRKREIGPENLQTNVVVFFCLTSDQFNHSSVSSTLSDWSLQCQRSSQFYIYHLRWP